MKDWYDIYRERMNDHYRNHVATKYAPFIEELFEVRAEVAVEIGCGAGNITRILREMRQDRSWYHLTDACPRMLGLAVENNPFPNCNFSVSDIRTMVPSRGGLVHSHGLLEHFSDREIIQIVGNMTFAAPVQIHYVPSILYKVPSRGDERLMEPDQWKHILRDFGRKVHVSTFNNDLDIMLRIEE